MKLLLSGLAALTLLALPAQGQLLITGIGDGPLSGGTPKFIELYASSDIADLSLWDVQNYNNGDVTPGTTFALSGSATAGSFLYVASEAVQFEAFFGFAPNFTSGVMNINGDDAVALRLNADIVDVYGVIGVDGTGEVWDSLDGSSYRVNGSTASSTFVESQWVFNGVNSLEGGTTNATVNTPFPVGSFDPVPEPGTVALCGLGLAAMIYGIRRRRSA